MNISNRQTDVTRDFRQIEWTPAVEEDCRQIVRLAVREDLDRFFDWTTVSLVRSGVPAVATVVARESGIVAGLRAAQLALHDMDPQAAWESIAADGDPVVAGQKLAHMRGSARSLLTAERIVLNLMGRLSGIATLTSRFVAAVAHTGAGIYDTRKTTPGWRRLEKYAVHCGGGRNHRLGLFDAILIKDNHLAYGAAGSGRDHLTPADAVRTARQFADNLAAENGQPRMILEVEVDTLEQLEEVLPAGPDIVLLDNMAPEVLRRAVVLRNTHAPAVELEASGGVNLRTVGAIAESGVERISAGALTHSAVGLDIGLDWGE